MLEIIAKRNDNMKLTKLDCYKVDSSGTVEVQTKETIEDRDEGKMF